VRAQVGHHWTRGRGICCVSRLGDDRRIRRKGAGLTHHEKGRRRTVMADLIHCSYHKCLTVFYRRVMQSTMRHFGGYQHFNSDVGLFEEGRGNVRVASVNNHALALGERDDARVSRFVRDPRDLMVSGYFYHRRAAEPWCSIRDPSESDLSVVNGAVPHVLQSGESFSDCLQRLDQESGLLAEMEFRAHHFASMRAWPQTDPRIRTWRYEDILGNESRVMGELAAHYEFAWPLQRWVQWHATRFSAKRAAAAGDTHVRNPTSGQWRAVFTPRVVREFESRWGDLLALHGYE
jgi:hypothetical protein